MFPVMLRLSRPIACLLVAALPLMPQQGSNGPAPADPVIRVTVGLVQVDAIVTDGKGNHVADLTADDFEITEDGKKQAITHFSYIRSSDGTAANPKAVKIAKNTPKIENQITLGPARQLRASEVRRMLVLVADNLGISAENIPRVKSTMKNFVDNQMQPGDLVSIMTTDKGMGALQQFTNDKRQLYASIERIRWVSYGRNGVNTFEAVNEDPVPDDPILAQTMQDQKDFEQAAENTRTDNFALGTMGTLEYVVQGLKELPGRKAIVLFSQGFAFYRTPTVNKIAGTNQRPPDFDNRTVERARKLTESANRAGVVMYSFDVRGLAVTGLTAADRVAVNPRNPTHISDLSRDRQNGYLDSQDGMEFLAKETGGLFFHERNDFEAGLAKTLDDLSGYYLIGYAPQRQENEKARAQFHKIVVRVKKPGLHVRSRNGYLGEPDTPPVLSTEDARKSDMRKALYSPFQMSDVHMKLSPFYSGVTNAKDPAHRDSILRGIVHIDVRDLEFKDMPTGKKHADVAVICAAYNANSQVVGSSDKIFAIEATPEQLAKTAERGINYQIDIPLAKPGPYQLRAVVRDEASTRTGSATAFVQIPDYNRQSIALSSLVLYEQEAAASAPAGDATMRVFAPGVSLGYADYVYNPRIDAATGKPKLEMEVRLYKDNQKIFASAPLAVTVPQDLTKTGGVIPAMGKIRIPQSMAPGDYSVVLIVYDRASTDKKGQAAVQWSDFTLVKPEVPVDAKH